MAISLQGSEQADVAPEVGSVFHKYLELGKGEGRAEVVLKLLRLRFGELPDSAVSRVRNATGEEIEAWAIAILSADSLYDVFQSPPGR